MSETQEQSDDTDAQAETTDATETSKGFSAIIEASTLQDAINSVSVLVDECKMRLHDDQFSIRAVDPANVGMVDLSLAAAAFESYEAGGGVIGVNLGRFEDIVGMANSGDLVQFDLDQASTQQGFV